MEVHEAGGGIHFTVEHTRKASQDELYVSFSKRLYDMLSAGTTCVECKSGYGLDTETEIKMLKVIETAKREHPLTISSTFCGAHAIPKYVKGLLYLSKRKITCDYLSKDVQPFDLGFSLIESAYSPWLRNVWNKHVVLNCIGKFCIEQNLTMILTWTHKWRSRRKSLSKTSINNKQKQKL